MKPVHYLSVLAALILAGFLFFAGNTVKPKKELASAPAATPGEQQAAALQMPEAADFEKLLVAAKKKIAPAAQAEISQVEHSIIRGAIASQQVQAYESLGKLWQKYKNKPIAAYYFAKSGKLENSEKKLTFAAHLQTEGLKTEQNPNVRQWMAEEAIAAYRQALEINPENDTTRIDLAAIYIEGTGEIMKGVEQLLAVVKKDPKHIQANIILGRMAVESGQLDKAIERGNTILSVDKENLEAYLFLGEAYKRKGATEQAKKVFNQAKDIMNNPDFSKDIDAYMKTF